jgi:hypothetical protein
MNELTRHTEIRTSFWLKPIPFRHYDWEAVLDNYEAGHPIGFGATEVAAIADLKEQIAENEPLSDEKETS